MTEQELIDKLTTDSVCGGQVYPVEARSDAAMPYAVYDVIRGRQSNELTGNNGKRNRYMFTCWCNTYNEAVDVIDAFRTSLDSESFAAGEPIIDRDPDDDEAWRITNLDFYVIEP